MSWTKLLAENRVERRAATKAELDELRAKVEAKLHHVALAESAGFEADERFSLAYDAARLAAVIAVRAAGYRVKLPAAHFNTFAALRVTLGPSAEATADYLDQCRIIRNKEEYGGGSSVSDSEADELAEEARSLCGRVEAWISKHHPELGRTP